MSLGTRYWNIDLLKLGCWYPPVSTHDTLIRLYAELNIQLIKAFIWKNDYHHPVI